MKRTAFTVFALLLVAVAQEPAVAQAPGIEWSHIYERVGGSASMAVSLMPDGGFMLGGYTVPPGDVYRDMLVIRTDSEGDTLFTKRFGFNDRGESLVSMKPTFDGGFLIAGTFNGVPPMTSNGDIMLIRIDANANWPAYTYYGEDSESESPACAIQSSDSGSVVLYHHWESGTGYDIFLIGFNSLGAYAWGEHYAWPDADYGIELCRTRDGGMMVFGQTQSADSELDWDIFLMKTGATGNVQWFSAYGSPHPYDEHAVHISETSDRGFLISGSKSSDVLPKDMLVIKTDSLGHFEWSYQIGGTYHDQARFGIETSDGGYAVVGNWANDSWDNFLIKFDANGDTLWTKTFGDSTANDVPEAIVETLDGGLVVTGTINGAAYPGGSAAFLTKIMGDPAIDIQSYRVADLGEPIGSASPTEHTITINPRVRDAHSAPLRGVLVHLDTLLHPMISDLEISLTHDGTTAQLVNRAGANGADFLGTVFSDCSEIPVKHGTAPFSGLYIPEESLSLFSGADPSGAWTLTITDHEAANDGTLEAWGITLLFDVVTGIGDGPAVLPTESQLSQNYPNPFNPTTTISYSVAVRSRVCIDVYNTLGQRVTTLVDTDLPAGNYTATWQGRDERGRAVSSGVYFYRLRAEGVALSRKMMYLK